MNPVTNEIKEQECPICLQEDAVDKVTLVCTHLFHVDCLESWINTQASVTTCPLCRQRVKVLNPKSEKELILSAKLEGVLIDSASPRRSLWDQVVHNCADYRRALGLSQDDLKVIERDSSHEIRDFLIFDVEGKLFSLCVRNICTARGWIYMMQVTCDNDQSLNRHEGFGTTLINAIPPEWHRKLLGRLDEDIKFLLRGKIDAITSMGRELWAKMRQNSVDYCRALNLSEADLEVINRYENRKATDFLKFVIEGKQFSLRPESICGISYGGSWVDMMRVICHSDRSLNIGIGGGTSWLNVIPTEWHQKLLHELDENIKLTLRREIDAISSKNKRR